MLYLLFIGFEIEYLVLHHHSSMEEESVNGHETVRGKIEDSWC